jgi:hypothetical protein
MDYDDLYKPRTGSRSWIDGVSAECREWLEGLADYVAEHGEPIWRQAHAKLKELFPDDAPSADTTIKETVRRLVRHSG